MKVGIMSMQRIPNIGSFLQAYGLMKMIKEMGHEVIFIDIPKGNTDIKFERISDKKGKNPLVDKIKKMKYMNNIKLYKTRHFTFFENDYKKYLYDYLNIAYENVNEQCDILVVGSDEVFNCLNYEQGFTTDTFGNYKKCKYTISYAASCGWTKYEFLSEEQKCEVKAAMEKMRAISVRDENTAKFVNSLVNKEITYNLDPVLVSNFDEFFENIDKPIIEGKYILVYGYYNRISELKYIRELKKLAKIHKCKLISYGAPQFWCDDYVVADLKNAFNIFKNAKYVITDTFHGVILSVRTKSNFVTIIRKSNYNKLSYLLKSLELEGRLLNDNDKIINVLNKKIDYEKTYLILKDERKKTLKYLKNNLEL